MAVLCLAEVVGGALALDATSKAVTASGQIGDVTLLVCGPAAAAEEAKRGAEHAHDNANGEQHQGIMARVKPARQYSEKDLDEIIAREATPFFLVLDGVTDPHNLGACLRSADAAGVHGVIVPKDKSAKLNGTARKVACGAADSVPFVRVTNLARTLGQLKEAGVWLIGTSDKATRTLFEQDFSGPLAIVMGAEGEGMRHNISAHCDSLAKLPISSAMEPSCPAITSAKIRLRLRPWAIPHNWT